MRDHMIVAMMVLLSGLLALAGVAWDRIEPVTSQKVSGLHYFNGSKAKYWGNANSSVYTGQGAFFEACENSLPIESSEGNGALRFRTKLPSGYWSVILRIAHGHPVNFVRYGGRQAYLSLHIRWAKGTEDLEIRLISGEAKPGLKVKDYVSPSPQWQTVNIPVADFVSEAPSIDLTRITVLQILGVGNYPDESLVYIDRISVTPSLDALYVEMVKVNQLGYLPDSPRIFILGYEPGGIGGIEPSSLTFNVRKDDTGETVLTDGVLTRDDPPITNWDTWDKSGDIVYHGDFSQITDLGEYVIEIPQLGQYSYPFGIGNHVYTDALRDLLRFFYYARSGEEMVEPYSEGYTRQAFFVEDRVAPYNFREGTRDVRGGWFDAGDPHKDIHAQVQPMWFLLEILENFRHKIGPGSLNIPESDGVHSDLYFLTRYGLDWMMRMCNPDGSVHFFVGYSPDGFKQARGSVSGVSSYSASTVAAIFAKAYRIYKPVPEFSDYADSLLMQAEKCWNWLQQHPENVDPKRSDGKSYGYAKDEEQDQAQRLVAAIELYETTGNELYNDYFKKNYRSPFAFKNSDWAGIIAQIRNNAVNLGYMDYIASKRPGIDSAIRDELKAEYIKQSDRILDHIENVPYKPGIVASNHIYWGSNGVLAGNVYTLLRVYEWTGKAKYRDAALENIHWICGRNPVSYCMISGHGDKPTDFYSFYWTDLSHQPPGYMTGGINEFALADYIEYPWKRYAAVHVAPTQEPWLGWNAQMCYALGYFTGAIGSTR